MSQGYDHGPFPTGDAPPNPFAAPPRRPSASPFASGPVAHVTPMKPGPGLPLAGGGLGARPQATSQLKTPLVVKPADSSASPFDHVADYSTANAQFHTADLSDPFQHVPEALTPFQHAPPTTPVPPALASNFNSADSASDELANMFGGPPPAANRDSFSDAPRPSSMSDPFSAATAVAPPPPAAPFLGYNQSPYASSNTSPMFAGPTHPSPSFAHRQPSPLARSPSLASPQRQTSTQILPPPRSVAELFEAFMAQVSPEMHPTPLPPFDGTEAGLRLLYDHQRWKSLEAAAASMAQTNDVAAMLAARSWQLVALYKQRNVTAFEAVVRSLGDLDSPQYQWTTYPESGKTGSMVPWRLHFLGMQLPRLQNNYAEYEAASAAFLQRLDIAQDTAADVWRDMTTGAMINTFIERKKLHLALRLSLHYLTTNVGRFSPWQELLWTSRVGRVHLQMGNLVAAERTFAKAAALQASMDHDCSARLLLNQGLLFFAQNKFKEALDTFNTILELHAAPEPTYAGGDPFVTIDDGDVASCAANNLAICALYSCEVLTAVNVLESVLQSDPRRHLSAALVFNLSTLYDLVCDNANATSRKEAIKRLADAYSVEHIEPSSFRI
ncbi:hypothetical protein SPRG_01856 [Saprolegnia parasitica CBS 223.65]|uniref:Uncharacterized protein n=1 Tax=Saprolegnia parasitica (strain CBS 223.65) TaxID=695850 RepID=A0A067D2Q6_SAPPC|nr:hypothetical protein SPRG_01856 [Saprolegnia parasitica CBS 223.65]KDO33041.1 hypothetical protein SPRG_01856 [Saprolegnia parasitica CBS 223.65]|eukprot:XP_012195812.1 hypothetical protein SPRG_01856 [Saprolegnia parasitica CBS 223.65]